MSLTARWRAQRETILNKASNVRLIVTKNRGGVQDADAGNLRRALEAGNGHASRHHAWITGGGQHHANGHVLP